MPLYEFDCLSCAGRFETLVSFGKEDEVSCPACSSRLVRKRLSTFGIGGGGSRLKKSGSSCAGCTSSNCSTCGQ
jgi:putative FmdB family regulatory protein